MGTTWFFVSFLALGIFGAEALTRRFETLPSERIGASAFLFLLCLVTSGISTFCYAENAWRLGRRTRWFALSTRWRGSRCYILRPRGRKLCWSAGCSWLRVFGSDDCATNPSGVVLAFPEHSIVFTSQFKLRRHLAARILAASIAT